MEQQNLFDSIGEPIEIKQIRTETCLSCEHRTRWQFGGSTFQYCAVRTSNRTQNGLLKIKCKTIACDLYKIQ